MANMLVEEEEREKEEREEEERQRYKLLGDCYVHGCMDGELVKDAQVDDWPTLKLV